MLDIRKFLLSKKTVLALILLITAVVAASFVFPQRINTTDMGINSWKEANPFWSPVMEHLGLDHIYTTPWFAALLFCFMLVLILSTYEQVRTSHRNTFGGGLPAEAAWIKTTAHRERILKTARGSGYLCLYEYNEYARMVKHPWGYWGNVLLHLSFVVVVASSLILVMYEKRGVIQLYEGETLAPGAEWLAGEYGLLADKFIIKESVTLERVVPEYWETDDLSELISELSIIGPQGNEAKHRLTISGPVEYKDVRIYTGKAFGDAFFVEFNKEGGDKQSEILLIKSPAGRDKPGYENFPFVTFPFMLKAKYFVDAEKKSMVSKDPLLVLRLTKGDDVIGEVPLRKGESGKLGVYEVTLVHVAKWTELIFAEVHGMGGIFAGFLLMAVGGCLTYFFTPRELLIKHDGDLLYIAWKATKFEGFFKEEYERIIAGIEVKDIL